MITNAQAQQQETSNAQEHNQETSNAQAHKQETSYQQNYKKKFWHLNTWYTIRGAHNINQIQTLWYFRISKIWTLKKKF